MGLSVRLLVGSSSGCFVFPSCHSASLWIFLIIFIKYVLHKEAVCMVKVDLWT